MKHEFNFFPKWEKLLLLVTVFSISPAFCGMAHAGLREKTVVANAAQATKIQGNVKDSKGEPIAGATVFVSGNPAKGTTSDANGNFTISAPLGTTLELTCIGFKNTKIVAKSSSLNIEMTEDSKQLNEIVFTGFGMTQSKESLTGAVSTIKSKDIARSSASTTSGALVGKIAGVNSRQSDGRPGASTNIQIRNMGTPLYVIDGIQMDEGQFNNIDFNDIESVTILKDASAAIYGLRAANGVVVVATKKGKINTKPTVSFNFTQGWQNLSNFAKPADAPTYISNYIQSQTIQGAKTPKYTVEDLAKWKAGTEKGFVPFNWYKYIWNTTPQTYLQAAITGGSEQTNYYVAVSHLNQDAMIKNYGGFTRSNVQMNINTQVNKRLNVGAGMNGRIEERTNPGVPGGDDYWAPIFAVYRNLPTKRPYANDNPNYPAKTSDNVDVNFAMLNYKLSGKMVDTWRVMQLNFNAEYEIFDGLKAKGLFSYYLADHVLNNQEYTYKLWKYENGEYKVDFENTNPWKERGQGKVEKKTTNLQLNYNKKFGEHSVAAIVGVETSEINTPSNWIHSIPTTNALSLFDYPTLDTYNDYGNDTQARLGYIGRFNYNYGQKYLFEASARYDGSWKFPPRAVHRSGSCSTAHDCENPWECPCRDTSCAWPSAA